MRVTKRFQNFQAHDRKWAQVATVLQFPRNLSLNSTDSTGVTSSWANIGLRSNRRRRCCRKGSKGYLRASHRTEKVSIFLPFFLKITKHFYNHKPKPFWHPAKPFYNSQRIPGGRKGINRDGSPGLFIGCFLKLTMPIFWKHLTVFRDRRNFAGPQAVLASCKDHLRNPQGVPSVSEMVFQWTAIFRMHFRRDKNCAEWEVAAHKLKPLRTSRKMPQATSHIVVPQSEMQRRQEKRRLVHVIFLRWAKGSELGALHRVQNTGTPLSVFSVRRAPVSLRSEIGGVFISSCNKWYCEEIPN